MNLAEFGRCKRSQLQAQLQRTEGAASCALFLELIFLSDCFRGAASPDWSGCQFGDFLTASAGMHRCFPPQLTAHPFRNRGA